MESTHVNAFSHRKFMSVGLFLNFAVLVLAAIVIQIFEGTKNDFFMHVFTVIHIFSGLGFTVLSVLHIKMHWQSMKGYMKTKGTISREVIYAILLAAGIIIGAILFVCFLMD
jgi:hypothetical protein